MHGCDFLNYLFTAISSSWAADNPVQDQESMGCEKMQNKIYLSQATITATIKNNNDHVEYFKISQGIRGLWIWKLP